MKVNFIGMIYFLHQGNERLVLLPNGLEDTHGVEPHYASFFLREADVKDAGQWTPRKVSKQIDDHTAECLEFRLAAPSEITISGVSDPARDGDGALDTNAHEAQLPQVKSVNGDFTVDSDDVDAIARLHVRRGTLTAVRISEAAASQLVVDHSGPIVISARSKDGVHSIELQPDSEIVFSNTSDILAFEKSKADTGGPLVDLDDQPKVPAKKSHFILFAKLDKHRAFEKLDRASTFGALPSLESDHPYIEMLNHLKEVPRGDCSNQCC